MTIEELLEQLEAEKSVFRNRYEEFYDRLVKIRREIRGYYECMFSTPEDIPRELEEELRYCEFEYLSAFVKYNDIRIAINIIKERAGI
jgi:hypothetical protein